MKKMVASLLATVIFLGFTALVVWGASFRLNVYNDAIFDGPEAKNLAPMLTTSRFWFNLQRWDTGWFRQIVTKGYDEQSVAFFPLYPLVLKAAILVVPNNSDAFPNAAFLISFLCTLIIVWEIIILAKLEKVTDPRLAAVFFLIFPTSFFLAAPYSEGLFIALLLGYILTIRQKQWWLAFVLGILLGLTRVNAIAAAIVPFYYFLTDWRAEKRDFKTVATWLGVTAAPALGLLVYAVYLHFQFGDALAFLHAQAKWGRVSNFSLIGLKYTVLRDWVDMTGVSVFHPRFTVGILNYAFTALGIGTGIWLWLIKQRDYAWLVCAFLAIPLSTGTVSSIPRLILPLVPFVAIVLAKKIKSPLVLSFFVAVNIVVWTFLLILFTRQYWVA